MNNRMRSLVILILLMSIMIVGLCACMVNKRIESDSSTTTMDSGYGVEDTFPMQDAVVENTEETVLPTEQKNNDENDPVHTTTATTPSAGESPSTPAVGSLTYEEYIKLPADKQQAYALTFPSVNDYIVWFNSEKEKYENDQVIEITGPIDLGEIAGKNK